MSTAKSKSGEATKTRTAILDATESIMREEGYAGVSSRKVAQAAGLKSQLVYYHFGTMDDLFLALYEREEERYLTVLAKALASSNPLRALWRLNVENVGSTLVIEFFALANHRKVIRKELARSSKRYYSLQREILANFLKSRGVSEEEMPPGLLTFLLGAISRALVTESSIGMTTEHPVVLDYVERWLQQLEGGGPRSPDAP